MFNISYCSPSVKCGLSFSTRTILFTQRRGKSMLIVKLSITPVRLHLKQKRLKGVYVQLLNGTLQINMQAKSQRWHIAYTYSCAVLAQSKRSECGTAQDVLFAFLSVRMPECERDYACQRIHVCTRSRLHPTGRMSHARATEGVQLSSFVLSMGHHLIPGQSRDETGPLKPLRAIVLSLSDKWEAGVHV